VVAAGAVDAAGADDVSEPPLVHATSAMTRAIGVDRRAFVRTVMWHSVPQMSVWR
jgi:hypothetical protein